MTHDPTFRITPTGRRLLLAGFLTPLFFIGILLGVRSTWFAGDNTNMQGGYITNLQNPASLADAANKNYTDNKSKVVYMGITGSTYKGGMGGFMGANSFCASAFAGSHICTISEMLRGGVTSSVSSGYVACDIFYGDSCYSPVGYITTAEGTIYGSCDGLTSNSSFDKGVLFGGTGLSLTTNCNTAYGIHCCK